MNANTAGRSLQLIATADIPDAKLDALTRDLVARFVEELRAESESI